MAAADLSWVNPFVTATQMNCMTNLTRTGVLSMQNRKPFRTARQKEEAQRTATKRSDGAWRSDAPVSYHPAPRG